jgi:tol-pal system protein YbgF
VSRREIQRQVRENRAQSCRLGATGLVLLAWFVAVPCNADEDTATTTNADAIQLIEILNQNDTLNNQIATLRGQVEVLLQEVERSGENQKIIAADFDRRLVQIEANPAQDTSEDKAKIAELESRMLQLEEALAAMHAVMSSTDQVQVNTNPADDAYEMALETYRTGDYEAAISEFGAFLEAYSNDAKDPNARYWLAEALLQQADYVSAIETAETLIFVHPDSDKVPDTIFLLGKAYLAMGDALSARDTWETLIADHADTAAAEKARDLLDRLP